MQSSIPIKPVILIVVLFLFSTFCSPNLQAQDTIHKKDTSHLQFTIHQEAMFEQMLSDPKNRRHLELKSQGWIPEFGRKTNLRFGGFVQANFIRDFQDAGFPYGDFITSLIPVPTVKRTATTFDPRPSRLTFETKTQTNEGAIMTFFSVDFAGSPRPNSIQPRLRQAYISWASANKWGAFLIGQANTTFMDGYAWPEIFDLEGPNAMTAIRQVIVRYSYGFCKSKQLVAAIAIEQPQTFVQNGIGKANLPDLTLRLNWKKKWGHLMFAALGRQLVAEDDSLTNSRNAFAYGLSLSGQFKIPYRQDNFQFQLVGGSGTGRYIQDLGALSFFVGQDGVYDTIALTLTPLNVIGGFGAFQHWWAKKLRTTVVGGYIHVFNLAIQPDDAYQSSIYALANLIYSPFNRFDIGIEYYWGQRMNKDNKTGFANRVMLSAKFAF
jgi:hypothetical protein